MKILVILLSFLILILPFQENFVFAQTEQKKRIAVFDFDGKGISPDEAATLTERFRSALVSTDKYIIVERQKINLVLDELGLQMTGVMSDQSLSEAGKLLGVQRIVMGTIGKIEDTYTVDLRVVDVETARLLGSVSRNTSGTKENLLTLLERIAMGLAGIRVEVKSFPLKIFSVPGNASVYLDGKYIGLSPIEVELEEGVHKVRVTLSGHEEWTGDVTLSKPDKLIAKLDKKTSKMKTWFWVGAGTLVAGGGILAAVLLGGSSKDRGESTPIGTPPNPPGN